LGIALKAGERIPLFLLLENRATDRVVKATIKNAFAVEIVGSPVNVPHLAVGEHFDESLAMPNTKHIVVTYDVFDGPGFTNPSQDLLPEVERFDLDELATAVDQLLTAARQADLEGTVEDTDAVVATVEDTEGLDAEVTDTEKIEATVEDTETINAEVDNDNDLKGNIEC